MKIVYTIAGFYRAAGMEKILSAKANYLAERGYDITIVTTEQKGRPNAFPLHPSIKMVDLRIGYEDNNGRSIFSKVINHPAKQRRHRKALSELLEKLRPDITISMFCGDESFLPSLNDGSAKVLEVHFSRFKRLQYGRHGLWAIADKVRCAKEAEYIRGFDRFVALTGEDLSYWRRPVNGLVIPNFLSEIPSKPSPLSEKTVIAVGRYNFQKGFDRLLEAWAITKKPDGWKLRLVGDGEERENLKRLAMKLGIQASVIIDGPQKDMDAVYRKASILAMTSRYEGLPMVLLEAQAYGIPAVAFRCKCGPADVISDGRDGILVKDGYINAMASALTRLMIDNELRNEMGANARKASGRWDKDKIMGQWIKLFKDISSSRR